MSILIYLGLCTSLLICTIIFRRPLYILLIRQFFGEYHVRYLDLLSTNTYFQSAYYVKGELSNQISGIKSAISLSDKQNTKQSLYFQNIKYGISSKELISILGKPVACDLIDMGSVKVVSLEYNLQANNVIDKYIYYFHQDSYYLGEFIFNKVAQETSGQILKSINIKYNTSFHHTDQFAINNTKGDYLNYRDLGYRISVSYFNEYNIHIKQLIDLQQKQRIASKSYYDYQINIQELSF